MQVVNTSPASSSTAALAAAITRRASTQTYYTIRLLADRGRVQDAYRAYAYFRWVDDELDAICGPHAGSLEFVERQHLVLDGCYGRQPVHAEDPHEQLLIDLVQASGAEDNGLQIYLRNMMSVMGFDAARRGRVISQAELNQYTWNLASAVTEALHYFIGRSCPAPQNETRYFAVSAAHITHMLRDTLDDLQAGYYNIPREVLDAGRISPQDVTSDPYRLWVKERVRLARGCFEGGAAYLRTIHNPRCRLACLAYIGRFTGVLDAIERDGFMLRRSYPETKGLAALLRACVSLLSGTFARGRGIPGGAHLTSREHSL